MKILSWTLAVIVLTVGSTLVYGELFASETPPGLIKGSGIYRSSEAECKAGVRSFQKSLAKASLMTLETPECLPVEGERDSFAPSFIARSEKNMIAETAVGVPTESEAACRETLPELIKTVVAEDETLIEAACVRLSVEEPDEEDLQIRYQAMAFLLKNTDSR